MLGFLVGFRKFFAFIFYFVITTLLMVMGYITGDVYMVQVTIGISAFLGTNLAVHLVNIGRDWVQGKLRDVGKAIEETKDE